MNNLLLVEDDDSLGATLSERLKKEGFHVLWCKTKAQAEQQFRDNFIDICVFDIGLPDGSGLDLARDLRLVREVPFVFLTSMNSAEYRLEGYELGAAEFIPKPFYLKEVLLLIKRVLAARKVPEILTIEKVSIDFEQRSVQLPDGSLEFPAARDFALLKMLIEHAPQAVSRERIVTELWNGEVETSVRSVDNAIVRLRQLFRRAEMDCIRSVRGVGYQWVQG